jgi:hypothetical protein
MKTAGDYRIRSGGLKLWWCLCVLALPGQAGRAFAAAQDSKGEVFKLREVSVFEQSDDSFLGANHADVSSLLTLPGK